MRWPLFSTGGRIAASLAFAAVLAASLSCYTGPHVLEFVPAHSGHGVTGELAARRNRIRGELLEVSDTAFVTQTAVGLVLIPTFAIAETSFEGLGNFRSGELVGGVLQQHRLMSRFPAGMPPVVLHVLLNQAGQTALKIITE